MLLPAVLCLTLAGAAFAQSPPTIVKSFGAASIELNTSTTLTFTITNPNPATVLTNVSFADNLPAGLIIANPDSLQLDSTLGACDPTGTSGTITAFGTSFTLTGGQLPANSTCTLSIDVLGTTVGSKVNTTNPITSTEGGTGGTATASVDVVVQQPTITKAFGAATLPVTGITTLTFTINNPNLFASLTNVGFSDPFPAGLAVATPNGLTGSCGGGTITATAGSANVSLAGATIGGSNSCTFTVNVTATATGPLSNTTGPITSAEGGTGGTSNTASLNVSAAPVTTTTLASSANPSSLGQAVTFTATVTSGAGTPIGSVTFRDAGTALGNATLAGGVATLTISTLALGTHNITASYAGGNGFSASNSAVLVQRVDAPADSANLRALQLLATKLVAQTSGAAISGAVSNAISEAFSESGPLISGSDNGLHFNFAAEPDPRQASRSGSSSATGYDAVIAARDSVIGGRDDPFGTNGPPGRARAFAPERAASTRVDDAFAGLAYADRMATKAPPPRAPKEWLLWADVRGTNWTTSDSAGGIKGDQINGLVGLTRKLAPNFLVGVVGGYETFDFTSQTLNGRLKGNGTTAGGYLGWRIMTGLQFDAGFAHSDLNYDGVSGLAAASFPGSRWLAFGGLTGRYRLERFELEPSARVYALWERQDGYVDSLGVPQTENRFSNGRASGGAKIAYPWLLRDGVMIAPYVGLYADYYFNSDGAVTLALPAEFIQGWSARAVGGISATTSSGARLSIGAEVGGLASDQFTTWTVKGRAALPF